MYLFGSLKPCNGEKEAKTLFAFPKMIFYNSPFLGWLNEFLRDFCTVFLTLFQGSFALFTVSLFNPACGLSIWSLSNFHSRAS